MEEKYRKTDLIKAHRFSFNNRESIAKSKTVGCFHCLEVYPAKQVTDWTKWHNKQTAFCPKCGIDAVIGDRNMRGINKEFLKKMRQRWF